MCSRRGWSKILQRRHAWPSTAAMHAFFNSMDREAPLVASAEAKPSAKQKKQGRSFPLPSTTNLFGPSPPQPIGGAPKGSRGRSESPLVASAEAKPSPKQKKGGRLFPCPPQEIYLFVPSPPQQIGGPRRGPGGDRKAPWSPPQRRNPPQNRKSEEGFSLALHKKSIYLFRLRPNR